MRLSALIRRVPTFPIVLCCLAGLAAYYALLTHVVFAAEMRRLLDVHFAAVPNRPGEALSIWLHNSRVVLGVGVCVALSDVVRAITAGETHGAERVPLWVGDAILTVWAVTVVLTAGVLLGAYGARQARAFWPYAPVEVTAWALLIASYIDARRGRGSARQQLLTFAMVEGLLAVAAVLEVGGLLA
jgi:hypothetical protein